MRKKWFLLASLMVVIGMLPSTILAAGWDIQGYHSVRAGETLYSIGRAYATRPEVIATVNGISTPNRVYDRILEKIRPPSYKRPSSAIKLAASSFCRCDFRERGAAPFTKITKRTYLCASLARPSV